MGQPQASQFCGLFIPCNRSLLPPRLPDSCRDKGTGPWLPETGWPGLVTISGAAYPGDHFPKPGVGVGTGEAGSPLLLRWGGGPPESGGKPGSPILNSLWCCLQTSLLPVGLLSPGSEEVREEFCLFHWFVFCPFYLCHHRNRKEHVLKALDQREF